MHDILSFTTACVNWDIYIHIACVMVNQGDLVGLISGQFLQGYFVVPPV